MRLNGRMREQESPVAAFANLFKDAPLGRALVAGFLVAGLGLLAGGCGSGGDRCGVRGEVSFEGQPVADGAMRFFPVEGTPGSGAGASIRGGTYEIPQGQGLMAGAYRVSITATRDTGREIPNPEQMPGESATIAEVVQYVPEKYNTRTTLRVELKPGENRQDFPLSADGKR